MKIYLFDIDGTLTPARQPMTEDFAEFFLDFCKENIVCRSTQHADLWVIFRPKGGKNFRGKN